jgi:hypothetical protein
MHGVGIIGLHHTEGGYGMKADSLNAKDLFEKNVRYVIPTFQRPYVWNKADQWQPLWEDVEHAADRYLEALDDGYEGAKAENEAGRHFLGAIVVQQKLTGTAEIETRNVIDGQQRLLTLQLLIDAAQEVAEENGWEDVAEGLTDLVLNNKRYARKEPDHVFKLWPTSADRDAFRAAMMNGAETSSYQRTPIVKAHDYFKFRIADWVGQAADDVERERRVHALETALLGLLELVVIDLGTDDDSFVIFETLNARGTPLLASDLVKNYVMQTASQSSIDVEKLHSDHWKHFETDDWWRQDVRQGRLTRPRIDVLLDYWLEIRRGEEVASHQVFPTFKKEYEETTDDLVTLIRDLKSIGERYRRLDEFDPWSPEGTFMYRWRTIDAGTSTPLLLWLLAQSEGDLGHDGLLRALDTLESFLVRRMVCRLTTKDYNRLFLDALSELKENDPGSADQVLEEYLLRQTAESRLWPSDERFVTALTSLPVYRLLTRARLRFILEAIEDELRGPKTEEDHVTRKKLTIEHILPQSWRDTWPAPEAEDITQASIDRDSALHTLGNLSLVTSSLNPALSNDPWPAKRDELGKHTVLMLNKGLLSEYPDVWDESTIRSRGEIMASMCLDIWDRPVPSGEVSPANPVEG